VAVLLGAKSSPGAVDSRYHRLEMVGFPDVSGQDPPPPPRLLRMPLLVIVGCAGLLFVMAALALVFENRRHTVEAAQRDNSNIARLVAFHVGHVLGSSTRLLDDVAARAREGGLASLRGEAGKRYLVDRSRDFPELQVMAVADAAGQLVVSSVLPAPPPAINYADREYFRRHQAGEDLVVGELVLSRTLGQRGTTVSRALRGPDGALEGVALVTIASTHFTDLFRSIQRSPNQAIAVLRTDGAVFVRLPELEVGLRFPGADVFAAAATAPSGAYEAVGAVDGLPRLIAYDSVAGFPLVVVASQVRDEVLAPWWTFTRIVIGTLLLAIGLLGAASVAAFRSAAEAGTLQLELERLADTDSLTGLANRRHFMTLAERELGRAVRYGGPLAVLMMDIDHFKKVNDSHGHRSGDVVLRRLAEVCRLNLRELDVLGRIGGEEFAIVLPHTTGEGGVEVAERLRAALESTAVVLQSGVELHFTVSIGVSMLVGAEATVDTLLNQADQALYEAKRSGRNRVLTAWKEPDQPSRAEG
jgi:diguanylate cyclase (GGDEF)-like protein